MAFNSKKTVADIVSDYKAMKCKNNPAKEKPTNGTVQNVLDFLKKKEK